MSRRMAQASFEEWERADEWRPAATSRRSWVARRFRRLQLATSTRLGLLLLGGALIVLGYCAAFTIEGAVLVFAGFGVIVGVALRAIRLPRWLALLGGLACAVGLTVQTLIDLDVI